MCLFSGEGFVSDSVSVGECWSRGWYQDQRSRSLWPCLAWYPVGLGFGWAWFVTFYVLIVLYLSESELINVLQFFLIPKDSTWYRNKISETSSVINQCIMYQCIFTPKKRTVNYNSWLLVFFVDSCTFCFCFRAIYFKTIYFQKLKWYGRQLWNRVNG